MVVDHGLRAEASTEAETALQQAEELGFKSILLQVPFVGFMENIRRGLSTQHMNSCVSRTCMYPCRLPGLMGVLRRGT